MLGNAQSKTVGVLVVAVAGLTVLGLFFAGQGIGVGAIAGTQNVVSEGGGAATQSMPPQADAGANRTATERTSLTLSAENSSMPDGEGLSYSWTQTGGPAVTLADDETASPTFTTPGVETATAITFEVTVTNSDGATDTDSVTIIVQPLVSESESTNITSQGLARPAPTTRSRRGTRHSHGSRLGRQYQYTDAGDVWTRRRVGSHNRHLLVLRVGRTVHNAAFPFHAH